MLSIVHKPIIITFSEVHSIIDFFAIKFGVYSFFTGSDLGPPHLATLLKSLIEGLQGRTWDGKEILLTSLRTVCISCSSAIVERVDTNQPDVSEVYI